MTVEHWENYYRGGALVSCPLSAEPNYTKEVREAWVDFFSALPDGARILDLGTGNGPIALIAKETAATLSRTFRIDAVDLADIDPPAHVENGESLFDGIRFHARVRTEDLPFADASMDAISGQYVLEYTDVGQSLNEIVRVLAPGGRCRFILHHRDSAVVLNALESLQHAKLAIHDLKLLRKLERFCETSAVSAAAAEPARRAMLDAGLTIGETAKRAANPMFLNYLLSSVGTLLQAKSRLSQGELVRQQMRFEREIRSWIRRLEDLTAASLSEDDLRSLIDTARGLGLCDIEYRPQMQDVDQLIGWRLTMSRP